MLVGTSKKVGVQGGEKPWAGRPNTPRPAGLSLLVRVSVSIFGRYEIRKF